jgi:hypothetical protein
LFVGVRSTFYAIFGEANGRREKVWSFFAVLKLIKKLFFARAFIIKVFKPFE